MVRDLHSQGVAHLVVRARDGTGLAGLSLVIPWTSRAAWAAPTYTAATATPRGRRSRPNCARPSEWPIGPPCWLPRHWRSAR